ncbi:hypothetical protein MYSTI_01913 [Myxococcus stipitatus DSM 14675]|uniref:Uncharacterized protein n=1 Tax=Myxococcus stipitatus (strain DSM 14675 / JCM 12634 / Mx s8) TaxID=1278073 RepID=L7U9U9_MYXSD|nr:hypothetical protein MYSTI_01913 [Myxococcus stipitatus DSM 14675]
MMGLFRRKPKSPTPEQVALARFVEGMRVTLEAAEARVDAIVSRLRADESQSPPEVKP